jgi:hypothetical protein
MTFCLIPRLLYLSVFRNVYGGDVRTADADYIYWRLVFVLQSSRRYYAYGFERKV